MPTGNDWRPILRSVSLRQAEVLIRAFSLYFQLTNLAEEKQRVRQLRLRERRAGGVVDESVAAAMRDLRKRHVSRAEIDALIHRLDISPVLTAHPTEARRRTLIVALRRVYRLLDALDDPRLTPSEDDRYPRPSARADLDPVARRADPLRPRRGRSTKSAARWPSSTNRSSLSCRGCTALCRAR